MKCLAALVCVVAAANAISFYGRVKKKWETYKVKHNKQYSSEVEDKFRMKIFAANKHNHGNKPYSLDQYKYADMLHHEFVHTMKGFNKTLKYSSTTCSRLRGAAQQILRLFVLTTPFKRSSSSVHQGSLSGRPDEYNDVSHTKIGWQYM